MSLYMSLICLKLDERSKRLLPWTAIASHKLHASGHDTIYLCMQYAHSNQQKGFKLLALLKKMARILESIFVDQKYNTIPSHHCRAILHRVRFTRAIIDL